MNVSGNSIQAYWDQSLSATPILQYVMEVGSATGASDIGVFPFGLQRAFAVASVPRGTYFLRVRAQNALGWGEASNERSFTTSGLPPGPTSFRAEISGRIVRLLWVRPDMAAGPTQGEIEATDCRERPSYLEDWVEYWTVTVAAGDPIAVTLRQSTVLPSSLWILDPAGTFIGSDRGAAAALFTASVSGTYRARVANPATAVGTYTLRAQHVTTPYPLLTTHVYGNQISLGWRAVSSLPILEYVLEIGSAPGASDLAAFSAGTLTTAHAAAARGTYFLRVRARDASGWGTPSVERAVTSSGLPAGPQNLVAPLIGAPGEVVLTWHQPGSVIRPPLNLLSYEVLVGSSSGASDLGVFPVGLVTWITVRNAPPGIYYVRVRAMTLDGPSESSNEIVVVR